MPQWSTLQERVAGKWQIPLLVLSLGMLVGAFLRVQPSPTRLSLDDALVYLDTLISNGLFERAIQTGDAILLDADRPDAQQAPIHLRLARARYREATRNGVSAEQVGRRIIEHYDSAIAGGLALTAGDFEDMGRALEWARRPSAALKRYETALARGVEHRSELTKHVITLRRQLGTTARDVNQQLDSFLGDLEEHRLDLRLWAIEQKIDVLDDLGELNRASTLLVRNSDRFRESDLCDEFSFLEALLLYKSGSYDEAETYLRAIRNRVEPGAEVDAKTGWLLGRVVLADGGPQRPLEALSFFEDVVNRHSIGPYVVAARLGVAESLAMLERHDEAVDAYRIAMRELDALEGTHLINTDVLRVSLGLMAQGQREAGNLRAGLDYARLAIELADPENVEQVTAFLEQLAQMEQLLAEELHRRAVEAREAQEADAGALFEEAHEMFASAAVTFMELARINTMNERRSAEAAWQAAELCAKADQRDRAIKLYQEFTSERPLHPLVPRALLRVGELLQAEGRLEEAIETYQDCYRRYPRTLDGSRVLIPLARCYLASGTDNDELAEKTLHLILDDSDVFTPRAPEFADALFLLGDLLNRRSEFERAIATLEEALERYPDDPRVVRATSLLADSYRHSALALKKEVARATSVAEIERMRIDSKKRFERARELYHLLIAEYELHDPTGLGPLDAMYLRHAYLYEADCLFEVGEYHRALELYEEAAGNYKGVPAGLAAYVQMINCHMFLGQPQEARAALARALILVEAIPGEAFSASLSPETRQDWKRYFEWLGESELF